MLAKTILVSAICVWFRFAFGAPECASVRYDNLDYGLPSTNGNIVIIADRPGFALGYDVDSRQPRWVCYRITSDEVGSMVRAGRLNSFKQDPALSNDVSSSASDYAKSGYDLGHIAPASDMAWSEQTMSDSFLMSNICPQRPEFNRGVWKKLEATVRDMARTHGNVFVYSGPIYGSSTNRIGKHDVLVPDAFFKVLLVESKVTEPSALGFIIPNAGSTNDVQTFCRPVSDVEKATGLDFFSRLPRQLQDSFEK